MALVPMILEQTNKGERSWDIFSRMLKDRIIFVNGEIEATMASSIVAQLLYLDSVDNTDITLYIDSPGGSISAGLSIIDTMNYIKSDVQTICMGMCASMGAMILCQGKKGKRFILPNAEVMIHQPLGGKQGQATDLAIYAKNILKTKDKMTKMMSEATGQTFEKVMEDTERDNWLDSAEALEYGIVDVLLTKAK